MFELIAQYFALPAFGVALAIYVAAFLGFRTSFLTDNKSIDDIGKLISFNDPTFTDSSVDYKYNKRGLVPVVELEYKGEGLIMAASAPNYKLTQDDIGKEFKIRYRNSFGFTLIIDEGDAIAKFNRMKNIQFWILFGLATCVLLFGLYAYIFVPHATYKMS